MASLEPREADCSSAADYLALLHGIAREDMDAMGARLTPLQDELVGSLRRPLQLLLAAAGLKPPKLRYVFLLPLARVEDTTVCLEPTRVNPNVTQVAMFVGLNLE